MLVGAANFEARFRKEKASATASKAAGINGRKRRACGVVHGVIDIERVSGPEPTAEHRARAGVAGTDANRQNERIAREIADPDGIKTLVENAEGREEATHGNGQIGIGDEIQLRVFDFFLNDAVQAVHTGLFREIRFESRARFEKPTLADRKKKHRGNERMDVR